MRLIRFIKTSLLYFSRDKDFLKRFPNSTKRRFLTMIKTAWLQSKKQPKPTQEEIIEHRVNTTVNGGFLR
ncbi:hypothetical protein LCGC14_0364960 [marine sediment metagenome]|uniref:Uncharacterized protein n=1 Tax=marine sediment metagenome TaxID=412755 RepID=A0A0F9TCS1_9ZZZZ